MKNKSSHQYYTIAKKKKKKRQKKTIKTTRQELQVTLDVEKKTSSSKHT